MVASVHPQTRACAWLARPHSCYTTLAGLFLLPALASAQSSAGQGLIFSHRSHLARPGGTCDDCHARIRASTSSGESSLPKESDCLRCHDGARARRDCTVCHADPTAARTYTPAPRSYRFDHVRHLALGNVAPVLEAAVSSGSYLGDPASMARFPKSDNACAACHRGVTETHLATEQHLPRMADCLVCHPRVDPPFSCSFCHTPDAKLRPASHTSAFADRHSNRREFPDKTGCKVCHGVRFTCMGCH